MIEQSYPIFRSPPVSAASEICCKLFSTDVPGYSHIHSKALNGNLSKIYIWFRPLGASVGPAVPLHPAFRSAPLLQRLIHVAPSIRRPSYLLASLTDQVGDYIQQTLLVSGDVSAGACIAGIPGAGVVLIIKII